MLIIEKLERMEQLSEAEKESCEKGYRTQRTDQRYVYS